MTLFSFHLLSLCANLINNNRILLLKDSLQKHLKLSHNYIANVGNYNHESFN